jgi:6-phosphogluconolactonase
MNSQKQLNNHPDQIIVAPNAEALTHAAAEHFVEVVNKAVKARERASVALSGGGTPRKLFELLAEPEWSEKIGWSKVHLFMGDERFVPPGDAQSNFRMANEALLKKVQIPAKNVHRFMTERGSAEEVAAEYERTIRDFFGEDGPQFDLILLGLGTNAHTASLFPNCAALRERKRLVISEYIDEVKSERLTFTVPLINSGRTVSFLVSGGEKAEVVREVLIGPTDPEQKPAQLIRPTQGTLTWLLDEPAARLLPASVRQ